MKSTVIKMFIKSCFWKQRKLNVKQSVFFNKKSSYSDLYRE